MNNFIDNKLIGTLIILWRLYQSFLGDDSHMFWAVWCYSLRNGGALDRMEDEGPVFWSSSVCQEETMSSS